VDAVIACPHAANLAAHGEFARRGLQAASPGCGREIARLKFRYCAVFERRNKGLLSTHHVNAFPALRSVMDQADEAVPDRPAPDPASLGIRARRPRKATPVVRSRLGPAPKAGEPRTLPRCA
jgi:hypothetical protein